MKQNYVENFVNPRYYVNLDFDNLMSYTECEHQSVSIPRIVVSILMLITMPVCIVHHWWIAFVFSTLLAFFSFPKTSRWLQNVMKVVFPNKFFWLVSVILLVATAFSIGIQKHCDDVKIAKDAAIAAALAEQQRQTEIAEKLEQERVAKEKEQRRLDSLNYHLNLAQQHFEKRKTMEAVQEYEMAWPFMDPNTKGMLGYKIANILFAKKQYEKALGYYWHAKSSSDYRDTLHYNKAMCLVKVGDVSAAVSALRQSPERTPRIQALFNKVNPVRTRASYVDKPVQKKRVAYYSILCRDGSTSYSSSRRGTCSRHGGVADWNHPVYETYTDNQKKKIIEKYREYGEW
jgi:tetratricopeptide (TPR) repeat protein